MKTKLALTWLSILVCAVTVGFVGCGQRKEMPAPIVYPITSIVFPDDCTDFASAHLATVTELCAATDSKVFAAVDGVLFTADLKTLVAFPGGRGGAYSIPDGTEAIRAEAFADCGIEEVFIPYSVKSIGNGAFAGCMELSKITLPNQFTADGNILPHSKVLPEYIIGGLHIHYRYSEEHPKQYSTDIAELLPDVDNSLNWCKEVKKDALQIKLPSGTLKTEYEEQIFITQTPEFMRLGGDLVIPEGHAILAPGDLEAIRYEHRLKSVTFANDTNMYTALHVLQYADQHIANYYVKESNPDYVSVDGVIFTKDMKTLVAFPPYRFGSYEIPDGTEEISDYAFANSRLDFLYVPDSVKHMWDFALDHSPETSYLQYISFPAHAKDTPFFIYATYPEWTIVGPETEPPPFPDRFTFREE